jgi:hypothetical protein
MQPRGGDERHQVVDLPFAIRCDAIAEYREQRES